MHDKINYLILLKLKWNSLGIQSFIIDTAWHDSEENYERADAILETFVKENPEYQIVTGDGSGEALPEIVEGETAIKHDKGKLRYDLLPPEALREIVKAFTFGADKYGDRNWEKGEGLLWGKAFGAIMRHCWAFWRGEDIDKESQVHHLGCAGAEVLFLLTYSIRGFKGDDRGVVKNNSTIIASSQVDAPTPILEVGYIRNNTTCSSQDSLKNYLKCNHTCNQDPTRGVRSCKYDYCPRGNKIKFFKREQLS